MSSQLVTALINYSSQIFKIEMRVWVFIFTYVLFVYVHIKTHRDSHLYIPAFDIWTSTSIFELVALLERLSKGQK